MIADMHSNKILNPIVTELFIGGRNRKPNLIAAPKYIRLNSTLSFIM